MSTYDPRHHTKKLYRVVRDGEPGFRQSRSRTYTSAKEALRAAQRLQAMARRPEDRAGALYTVYVSDVGPEREGYEELLLDAGATATS